jgi:hypothetical protein
MDNFNLKKYLAENELANEFTRLKPNPIGEQLAEDIYNSIIRINDSMSYKDFAFAVARVLEDSYGTHNYDPFISKLKSDLDKMRD